MHNIVLPVYAVCDDISYALEVFGRELDILSLHSMSLFIRWWSENVDG